MEDRFVAMEGFLDKFRKSKMDKVKAEYQEKYSKYPSVGAFVDAIFNGTAESKYPNDYRAMIGDIDLTILHPENADAAVVKKFVENAIKSANAVHKSVCMGEIDLYNSSNGTDGPWAWVERENATFEKKNLSDIEREISLALIHVSFYENGNHNIEYWFDDGPSNLYGGHSLITSGRIDGNNCDFRITKDGKFVAPIAGKYVSANPEG